MRYEEDMSTCLTDSLHAQQQPAAPIPSAGPTVKICKLKDLQAQTEKAERQRRIDSSNLGKRTLEGPRFLHFSGPSRKRGPSRASEASETGKSNTQQTFP
eukprot:1158636-Prorocentrum_minimum.AAC.2